MVRDWFREQVLAPIADYKVNATGSQMALLEGDNSIPPIAMGSHLDTVATGGKFDGPLGVLGALEVLRSMKAQNIKTRAPLVLINWANEEGARFFPLLGSSCVYAEQSTVEDAHASISTDNSSPTIGGELAKIGYVGDGPNYFDEFPISAHLEIYVEQHTDLEKAGKPVCWVEGWQGMTCYNVVFHGDDGHANTKPMYGRRDRFAASAKLVNELENLAYEMNDYTTTTGIHSHPFGSCNIQSKTKVVFCLMHNEAEGLEAMGEEIGKRTKSIAGQRGLYYELARDIHPLPGNFWPEAIACVRDACDDKGITMTTFKVPTAMAFVRVKGGISHSSKEWSDKEDCAEGALVLGKAVLNFDEFKHF
ncbi:Zn-dependent exopeptidase [Acephala macrosclerotiorum]|nr:Zn-dependent exopeptidase [Acephala macrosclerotiorum]